MDLPPSAQEPDRGRVPPHAPGAAARAGAAREDPVAAGELQWRLSQLEAGLRHIDRRLQRLEESVSRSIAEQTQAVGRDLRHTVSELGRRLVLELPQVLARHRDEIVAELRPIEPAPEVEPEADVAAAVGDAAAPPEPPPAAAEATAEAHPAPPQPVKRRRRVHVLRQRDA
jgi:hypothetical protein